MSDRQDAPSSDQAGSSGLLDEATRLAESFETGRWREGETRILRALVERVQQAESDAEECAPILDRQGELLTGVANALRGDPPPLTTWSHHDLPELAAGARAKLDKVRAYIRRHGESAAMGREQWGADMLAILDET